MVDWLNANQGATLALLTAVYVVATIYLAWSSRRSNRLHAKNIDMLLELEKRRNRPVVILRFEQLHQHLVSVVLVNIGKSVAFDINVDINPLPRYQDSEDPAASFLHKETLSLAPGAELRALVGYVSNIKELHPDLTYRGEVSYQSQNGTEHNEPFRIDLNDHLAGTQLIRRTVHDVAKRLEAIEDQLKKLKDGAGPPLIRVQSEEEYKEQRQREAERMKERWEALKEEFGEGQNESGDTNENSDTEDG